MQSKSFNKINQLPYETLFASLKNYFHTFSNSKLTVTIVIVSLLYILPILLTNAFYIDDMNRTTEGYDWNRDGRFISSEIMHRLSFQKDVVFSGFPFSTIFSALLLSFSGYLLSYLLGIRDKFLLLIGSLLLLTCPFVLEILLYKFDCLPISLSIFFAILPFVFYHKYWKFALASTLFLFFVFGLYQTTAFCYAIVLIYFTIDQLWKQSYKKLVTNGAIGFFSFLFAFLLYNYKIKQLGIEIVDHQRSEFIFKADNFLELLKERFIGFRGLLDALTQSSYKEVALLVLILSFVGFLCFVIQTKWNFTKIILVFSSVALLCFVVVLAIGINLFVYEARWSPRSLIGYAFVTYILLFAIHKLPKCVLIIGKLSFIPFIYFSYLLMSQLNVFIKNKEEFSDFVLQQVATDVLKYDQLKLVIDGELKHAERNKTIQYHTLPFIYKLAPKYENYSFYWGMIRMNKFGMFSYEYVHSQERDQVLESSKNYPMIQSNNIYELRIQEPYAVVKFK